MIERGGRVDKYIGDNVMAVFGAPVAHEDDPERAVRAGLAMQAAMGEINAEIGARAASQGRRAGAAGRHQHRRGAGRADRGSVHGDRRHRQRRGAAPGRRARVGAVTVGRATRRLTAAAIEYRDLEPLALKGKAEPMPAWEAVGVVESASQR